MMKGGSFGNEVFPLLCLGFARGAAPHPAENLFAKRFSDSPKNFGKIIGLIPCGSVLSERTASSYWDPYPKMYGEKSFRHLKK